MGTCWLIFGAAAALVLRGCGPFPDDAPPPPPAAAEEAAAPPTTTPDPFVVLDLSPTTGADAAAGAALREAQAAIDRGDAAAAHAALDSAPAADLDPGLAAWLRAEAWTAAGEPDRAAEALAEVPDDDPRGAEARLRRAARLLQRGESPDALLQGLGSADALALRARAAAAAGRTDEARTLAWAAWSAPDRDEASDQEAVAILGDTSAPPHDAAVARGLALATEGDGVAALAVLGPMLDTLPRDTGGCAVLYELGRALYRAKKTDDALEPLRAAAAGCAQQGDTAPRALYLLGRAEARLGRDPEATLRALADDWSGHRLADDALFHLAEFRRERGGATGPLVEELARRFPDGDMTGRGVWLEAWPRLAAGDRATAEQLFRPVAQGDLRGPGREAVAQARYWTAAIAADDPARRAAAVDDLAALAESAPTSWYGVLAYGRLRTLDAARAAAVRDLVAQARDALRAAPVAPPRVARALAEDAVFQRAVRLLRAGVRAPAAALLGRALGAEPWTSWDDETLATAAALYLAADDPQRGHNLLRFRFRERFPNLTPEARAAWERAWPLPFDDAFHTALAAVAWPQWLFRGLVREESAFASAVRSHAGAMGLSQLMWPTAKESARRMGIPLTGRDALSDPTTNLRIGAWYLDSLVDRWSGHLPLAIGSYNAGPGAMARWLGERGDLPLDAFVETIPFTETRDYIKRVTGSWQAYTLLYGGDTVFVPLRVGPVQAALGDRDPPG